MLNSISTAKVEKKNIEDEYSFYGKISADKNSYIDVYPLVGGNVMSVNVELGDYVKKKGRYWQPSEVLSLQKFKRM